MPQSRILMLCSITFLAGPLLGAQVSSAQSDPRTACAADVQKLCAGVPSGEGRILACLKQHKDEVSDGCKQAFGLPASSRDSSTPSAASSPAKPAHHTVDGPSVPAAASKAKPAPAPKGAREPVILGERFVQRTVVDTQQGGMTAVTVHVPENWHFESKVEWHYGWVDVPVNPSWHAENPANAEAYFHYETWRLVDMYVAPQGRQYVKQPKLGDRYFSGEIHMVPVSPLQAMAAFIKNIRGDVTNLKWLGQQDLPHLAKALRQEPSPNQHGVAIKIGYDLNGKPVEEAFFGVYYMNKAGTQAMQAGHQAIGAMKLYRPTGGFRRCKASARPPAHSTSACRSIV